MISYSQSCPVAKAAKVSTVEGLEISLRGSARARRRHVLALHDEQSVCCPASTFAVLEPRHTCGGMFALLEEGQLCTRL
jgi:hypothetical protein